MYVTSNLQLGQREVFQADISGILCHANGIVHAFHSGLFSDRSMK
jgi:hypothetical protein